MSCSDSTNCTIDVKVTNFSAKHAAGGNITYYSAPSAAVYAVAPVTGEMIAYDLPGVTVSGLENAAVGKDCWLTLTGENLPDVLVINVSGNLHMVGENEELVAACAAVENAAVEYAWHAVNDDGSQLLVIPAELMTGNATIFISDRSYDSFNLADLTYGDLN